MKITSQISFNNMIIAYKTIKLTKNNEKRYI